MLRGLGVAPSPRRQGSKPHPGPEASRIGAQQRLVCIAGVRETAMALVVLAD
jgi:hypothetical protein